MVFVSPNTWYWVFDVKFCQRIQLRWKIFLPLSVYKRLRNSKQKEVPNKIQMSIENVPNHTFNTKSEFEELRQNSWDKWSSAACKCTAATRISNCNLSYPLRSKTCTILNRYAASYTDLTLKSSTSWLTMKSPRNGPANRTCQPAQECCWCRCCCYETSQDFSFLWDWVSQWTLMNWTLQLGVGAFIYILPSRTNPPIAHGQNNSGAYRTRFLYVPDISICKLWLPSRWLVRCDVILISDRHKTGDSDEQSLESCRQLWNRWTLLKNCSLPIPKRILSIVKATNWCRETGVVRQFMHFNKTGRTARTRYWRLNPRIASTLHKCVKAMGLQALFYTIFFLCET